MRSTALIRKDEYDEVPVSSTEVLEANVAALRDAFNDFRNEVRDFKNDVRTAFANLHDEVKSLREKSDKNFERLSTKIDATNQEVAHLSKDVTRTQSDLSALKRIWGGLGGLAVLFALIASLNKVFHWY
jgi:predicted  nucleic acid-binding Zn-ribbon protein